MTKKKVFSGFCDGFTQGIILYLLLVFTVAPFADGVSVEGVIVIPVLLALLSPLSYYVFVLRSGTGKRLLGLSLISFFGFAFMAVLSVLVPWERMLFPNKLVCFSTGMIQQLEMLVFLAASVVLRSLVLIVRRIKRKT